MKFPPAPSTLISIFLLSLTQGELAGKSIEQWQVIDLEFAAESRVASPFEVEFGAVFTNSDGMDMRVPGFYNGGRQWLLRFCPPETGEWAYRTYGSLPELAGKEGSLTVTENTRDWQKGPIEISTRDPQKFIYADGSPYFLLAFELDWLFALDAENPDDIPVTRKLVHDIARHGFNQIVMNVFAYDAPWGEREKALPEHLYSEPSVFPFGGDNKNPDYSTLDVEYFKRFDRVIAHLNEQQIVSHLMIYVWNKMVNWPEPESVADNRYFDYVVKRYQAYPNLIWDISKEALAYGRDDMGYITKRIERLRRLDGHGRLLSVHDYNYCSAHPDKVDFISIQEWEPYLYYRMRHVMEKHSNEPVFNIEHGGYEKTTYSIFDGAYTDPIACLDRNYQCIFAGVYSTYYWQNTSWYNVITEPFALPEDEQPHFSYYRNIVKLLDEYDYNALKPDQNAFSSPFLTNGDDLYLFYVPNNRRGIFGDLKELKGKHMRIRFFDPLTGLFHEGWKRDFSESTWLGVTLPDYISGQPAIVILEELKDGWVPLLDQNNLDNWTFDVLDDSSPESIYSIKDGVLNIAGKDKSTAVIRTKKSYSDYELKWEWRWPDEPGNSGCLIHCSAPRNRNIWPQSLEVQMAHEKAGDFIYIGETIEVTEAQVPTDIPEGSWMVRLRHNLTDGSERAPGQWNEGRIVARGDTVTVYINGELVNKGWNCSATSGAICFQSEKANVQYRNIRIREKS